MPRVVATVESTASPEALWRVLTHHEDMPKWAKGVRAVHLDPIGAPDPDGLGAVRHIHALGPALVERVVEWDPPHRYVYRLERGAPIKDHRGEVRIEPSARGSHATWEIRFRPLIPLTGWAIRMLLSGMARDMLRKAAEIAEGD